MKRIMLLGLILVPVALALYGGETAEVMFFEQCSQLNVTVTGNLTIDEGEYELVGCTQTADNFWECPCYNNYSLIMSTQAATVNDYHLEASYTYQENNDLDDDGVSNDADLCPHTVIPEQTLPRKALGVNRLVLTEEVRDEDGYVYFMTSRPRNDMPLLSQFTTEDSNGCSCEQILQLRGTDPFGAKKYGCPRGYVEGGNYIVVARIPASAYIFA